MSKQSLQALVNEIKDGTSKAFREGSLNKEIQVVDLTETSIATEIQIQLFLKDPDLLDKVDSKIVGQAAQVFRRHIRGTLSSYIKGDLLEVSGKADNYRVISSELTKASQKAIEYLEAKSGQSASSGLTPGRFIAFDHTRTSSDTRISSLINNVGSSSSLLGELKKRSYIIENDYNIITDIISYYTSDGTKVFQVGSKVEGALRSGADNESEAGEITKRKNRIRKALIKAIQDVNWPEQAGSDSKIVNIRKRLNNAAVASGAKGVKLALDTSSNKASDNTKITQKTKATQVSGFTNDAKSNTRRSNFDFASIIQYLNSRLAPAVRERMRGGALHNRSGRFSESVRVLNITESAQGFPVIEYTYQRSPYDVFDPVLGAAPWNQPGRDPKKLIEVSIRDIAKDIAIKRFYVRRA